MDINAIKAMDGEGMTQKEIGIAMGIHRNTVGNVLGGGQVDIDRIADRMEYFLGGATVDSGCYRAVPEVDQYEGGESEEWQRSDGKENYCDYNDIVPEEADMEIFIKKIGENMD